MDKNHPRSVLRSRLNGMTTSVGRFYEKRHQFHDALDQYSKVLSSDPDDTATYIDRSRVLLKMGSIHKAQEDTGEKNERNLYNMSSEYHRCGLNFDR